MIWARAAGQRQDRSSAETAGQIHYQHIFTSHALGSVRGMVRDLTAQLWSNPSSTPVYVEQNRGFREGALVGSFTIENEHHTLKFGGDLRVNDIRERFRLAEPDDLPEFKLDFNDRQRCPRLYSSKTIFDGKPQLVDLNGSLSSLDSRHGIESARRLATTFGADSFESEL
jgi:hypothetical protein